MQVTENTNELVLHYYSLAPLQKECAVLDFDPIFRQWALSSNDMNLESSKNIVSKSSKTRGTKIFTPGLIVAQTSSCREYVKTKCYSRVLLLYYVNICSSQVENISNIIADHVL